MRPLDVDTEVIYNRNAWQGRGAEWLIETRSSQRNAAITGGPCNAAGVHRAVDLCAGAQARFGAILPLSSKSVQGSSPGGSRCARVLAA